MAGSSRKTRGGNERAEVERRASGFIDERDSGARARALPSPFRVNFFSGSTNAYAYDKMCSWPRSRCATRDIRVGRYVGVGICGILGWG